MEDQTEELVNIDYRQLSYAEVARMLVDKAPVGPSKALARPRPSRPNHNQYEVLHEAADDEDLVSSLYMSPEKFKTNRHYMLKKVHKDADRSKSKRKPVKKQVQA